MAAFGEQFSSGDQSIESRKAFYASNFASCVKCHDKNMVEDRRVAGCRMNGDAYGTTVFACALCKWSTSFQWDDAADCYYYETRDWKS